MEEAARATKVAWLPWSQQAFAAAAHLDRPILLAVSAPWCRWCHEMDANAYSDPGIAAHLNDGFVPVRVDADRNPRVRDRYTTGGFPSTVFLTPEGRVIAGAGHLETDGLRRVLETVRERWRAAGGDAGTIPRALRDQSPPGGSLDGAVESHLTGQLEAQWDEQYGGWGNAEKFPLPRTISFALKRNPELARDALDLVIEHLQSEDGVVYRHAARDWSTPVQETLTDTIGGVLTVASHGYALNGTERYRQAAEKAVAAVTGPLWVQGGVAASRGSPEDEQAPGPDGVDPTHLADRNAVVTSGLLWFSAYTGDETAKRYACRCLDMLQDLTKDGLVAHYEGSGPPRGLLADQAMVLEALVTAVQVLGCQHRQPAREVADATIETLQAGDGAFLDGVPEGPGLLDHSLRPLDRNAVLADALITLSELTGVDQYREIAREALAAFAGAADRIGVQIAVYGTAVARLVGNPLVLNVAGDPGTDLHRAALRVADHEKVVRPEADGPSGTAWIETPGGRSRSVETPDALLDLVRDTVA